MQTLPQDCWLVEPVRRFAVFSSSAGIYLALGLTTILKNPGSRAIRVRLMAWQENMVYVLEVVLLDMRTLGVGVSRVPGS